MRNLAVLLATMALLAVSCRSESPLPLRVVGWRTVASWSGHGNAQLDTFPIERQSWRIKWETTNESPAGAGTFRVSVHSADSGRTIADAVDVRGVGRDVVEIDELPHRFYLAIESKSLDWSVSAEEPLLR